MPLNIRFKDNEAAADFMVACRYIRLFAKARYAKAGTKKCYGSPMSETETRYGGKLLSSESVIVEVKTGRLDNEVQAVAFGLIAINRYGLAPQDAWVS